MSSLAGSFRIPTTGIVRFGTTDSGLSISSANSIMSMAAAVAAGGVRVYAGTEGIQFDATRGSGATGSVNGAIALTSQLASNWTNSNSALSLIVNSTSGNAADNALNLTTSGSNGGAVNVTAQTAVNINATTTANIDSTGATNIGTTNATGVTVGRSSTTVTVPGAFTAGASTFTSNVTVDGNLVVNGTTTTVDSTTVELKDNLIVLNAGPDGSDYDAGILMQFSETSILATTPSYTGTAQALTTYNASGLMLNAADTTTNAGAVILITNGAMTNQSRYISSVTSSVATMTAVWTPVLLTGSAFDVTGTGTALTGTGSAFTTQLQVGASLTVGAETYIISSITDNLNAVLAGGSDVSSSSAYLTSPGTATYNAFNNTKAALIYQAATDSFVVGYTSSDPSSSAVTVNNLANLRTLDISVTGNSTTTGNTLTSGTNTTTGDTTMNGNMSLVGTGTISNDTGASNTSAAVTAAALLVTGSVGSNRGFIGMSSGTVTSRPTADFRQIATDSTQPALSLTQLTTTSAFANFSGTSVGTTGQGGSNLTNSLVESSASVEATSAAFLRVNVTDANGLCTGSYYVQLNTLASI